jgi:hypothetical protein
MRILNFILETDENKDENDNINDKPPNSAERIIFGLYSFLLKDFNNISDKNHPE